MDYPAFCCENVLDAEIQYPGHTLTANEEATGHEVWRVANARRHPSDYWTPETANAAAYIDVAFGGDLTFDFFALDRGHNLGGHTVKLQDPDNAYADILSVTVPSSASSDAALTSGARTPEGAYVYALSNAVTASGVRIRIPAMGAGLKPQVVGAWVGLSWQPGERLPRPVTVDPRRLRYAASETPSGWIGAGQVSERRDGEYTIRLRTMDTTDAERFLNRYSPSAPAWIIADMAAAEGAFLAIPPSGADLGLRYSPRWAYGVATIPFLEHAPLP